MRANYVKVNELCDSWLNGNRSYVRGKVKNINKVEFVLLCVEITNHKDNLDMDQIAFQLTS